MFMCRRDDKVITFIIGEIDLSIIMLKVSVGFFKRKRNNYVVMLWLLYLMHLAHRCATSCYHKRTFSIELQSRIASFIASFEEIRGPLMAFSIGLKSDSQKDQIKNYNDQQRNMFWQ